MTKIQAVAIFCGSRSGNNPLFAEHAAELGRLISILKIKLVYGGGKKGLMGIIADSVLQHHGSVMGVIPKMLVDWEQQHEGLTELAVVPDMHSRKKMLYDMCDAAIILPGGIGTLDELFEMLTWNQLSIHDKKIFILNSGGFYNHLLQHLQIVTAEGFLYGDLQNQFTVLNTPAELLNHLKD